VLLRIAVERGFSTEGTRPVVPLALAVLAYAAAVEMSTNGFVAAFVGGMAFGSLLPASLRSTIEFAEEAGALLSSITWFLFGAAMIVPAFERVGWRDVVFAVLALTVVRMVPVAIASAGLGLDRRTVAFIGWFGPRGLASVIFALLAVDTLVGSDADRVLAAVATTVVLSVVLHGITASPFAARYGAAVTARRPQGPEHSETGDLVVRTAAPRSRRDGTGDPGATR
jgi:NhaP-type Na+/H+ or K+/H+ antiporter